MRRAPAVSGGRRRRDVGAALCLVRAGRPMLLLRGRVDEEGDGPVLRGPPCAEPPVGCDGVAALRAAALCLVGGQPGSPIEQGITEVVRDGLAALAAAHQRPVLVRCQVDRDTPGPPRGLRQRRSAECFSHRSYGDAVGFHTPS